MKDMIDRPTAKRALGRPQGSTAKVTKEKLLIVAADQFGKQDYAAVSLAKIAKSAGLTGAAIYHYYDSKDALFLDMMLMIGERNIESLTDAMVHAANWKEKINVALEHSKTLYIEGFMHPSMHSTTQNKITREPEKFRPFLEFRKRYSKIFQNIILDAMQAGDLPKDMDVPVAGDLLMALLNNGIGAVAVHRNSPEEIESIIETFKVLLGTKN